MAGNNENIVGHQYIFTAGELPGTHASCYQNHHQHHSLTVTVTGDHLLPISVCQQHSLIFHTFRAEISHLISHLFTLSRPGLTSVT